MPRTRVPFALEPRSCVPERGGADEHEGWCDECGWQARGGDADDRARYHAVMTGHRTMSARTQTTAWQPEVRDHTHPCGTLAEAQARFFKDVPALRAEEGDHVG